VDVPVPNATIFGRTAGQTVPIAYYVTYPTSPDNPRPDYDFPYTNTNDYRFPHMQRPGEGPIFADENVRYPLVIFSHGQNAHGIWDLVHMKFLASHGYIVASVQHGDRRNTIYGLTALRPLAVQAVLDDLLADPDFGPAIDLQRIAVSGLSMGGCTVLAVLGGGCFDEPSVPVDERFRAGFGFVPYSGVAGNFAPFGDDRKALAAVREPFFAVYGAADTTVTPATVESAVAKTGGSAFAVRMAGEGHLFSAPARMEGYTYEVVFFDAWLKDDARAMRLITGDLSVDGGVSDTRTYQREEPPEELPCEEAFGVDAGSLAGNISVETLFANGGLRLFARFPGRVDADWLVYDLLMADDPDGPWTCLRTYPSFGLVVPEDPAPAQGFQWRYVEAVLPGTLRAHAFSASGRPGSAKGGERRP
jgi:hypothetical protein